MKPRGRALSKTALFLLGLALASCSGKPAEAPASATPTPAVEAPQAPAPAPSESPAAAADTHYSPEQATGAVKGIPAPTNTAPIVAVANYFTELPGLDVAALKTAQKERFLQRVNSELCTCGCKNDTLARCYVNDPRCPVVKGMVQRVYDEVKTGR